MSSNHQHFQNHNYKSNTNQQPAKAFCQRFRLCSIKDEHQEINDVAWTSVFGQLTAQSFGQQLELFTISKFVSVPTLTTVNISLA